MKVVVDFAITLLNRDHFSENQTYSAKSVKFTSDAKSEYFIRWLCVDRKPPNLTRPKGNPVLMQPQIASRHSGPDFCERNEKVLSTFFLSTRK